MVDHYGQNPSHFSNNGAKDPVEKVSWDDAKTFIRKLNARGVGTFRLPTEAEWEYACRAGTTTPYSFGSRLNTDMAVYLGLDSYDQMTANWHGGPKSVGTFEPNSFGLYDMHGNVWEWCEDTYEWYPPGPADNPLIIKSDNPNGFFAAEDGTVSRTICAQHSGPERKKTPENTTTAFGWSAAHKFRQVIHEQANSDYNNLCSSSAYKPALNGGRV